MKIIQCLTDKIHEELADAKAYEKLALRYKEEYPDVARLFDKLSGEEMEHMVALHNAAAYMISDYRKEHGEPPADMMTLYNYLHEKEIESAAEVKRLQAMFRE